MGPSRAVPGLNRGWLMQDTIFALATGTLGCAVAIVRVSGPQALSIAERFCGSALSARKAHFREIHDPRTGELIDSGLVISFPCPSSFTGEDCLEFQIHGSRAVVARLLRALGEQEDCRLAEPGEFIRRAFDNGKMPLTSIEGIADLIDARTEAQRKQALAQAGGHLAEHSEDWRVLLLDALTLIEAEIDFADEGEAPTGVLGQVRPILSVLKDELRSALAEAERGERIRNGFRVVIAGPPNAGKSSLMNALVRRDVAIVTEHAGTTRDVIEVEFDLGGFPVILCDTAGLRETTNPVETIGIERTRSALDGADLVLWLYDTTGSGPQLDRCDKPSLVIATKTDLSGVLPDWADLGLSAREGQGLDALMARLAEVGASTLSGEPPLITNGRQRGHIESAARHLQSAMAEEATALELVAEDLRQCSASLQSLMGRIGTEDILGSIFSRFCMGK